MVKSMVFAGLLLCVTPAIAQNQAPPASGAPQAAKPANNDDTRVICQTQKEIGSRLASKRICMTATQWKQHEQAVHDQLDQMHTNVIPTGGPG